MEKFLERLLNVYVPEMLTREMDLLGTTNPDTWIALRRMFTGHHPDVLKSLSDETIRSADELLPRLRALLNEVGIDEWKIRSEMLTRTEYIKQLMVSYFENRNQLPQIPIQAAPDQETATIVDTFLRGLKHPKQ